MREIRWKCDEKGCYRQLMPRLGVFDECFDGRIGMSDVDGIVEIAGSFLIMEWKAPGGAVSTGQRIMFERLTALSRKLTVILVHGNPADMSVTAVRVFHSGAAGSVERCDIRELKARIFAWAERAKMARVRPSMRAQA